MLNKLIPLTNLANKVLFVHEQIINLEQQLPEQNL